MDADVKPIEDRLGPIAIGLGFLAASPLVFHLSSQSPFILPKFLYIALVVSLLLCSASRSSSTESIVSSRRMVVLPLILWLFYSVLSFPWFGTAHADIREPFSLGVLLLTLSLFAFRPLRGRESAILIGMIFLVGTIESLYGIGQYLGIDLPVYRHSGTMLAQAQFAKRGARPFATFGNPNFFAEYLAGLLPLAIAAYLSARSRQRMVVFAVGVISMFAALMLTGTRAAWVGSLVGCLLLAVWGGAGLWRRKRAWLLAGIFIVLALPSLVPIKHLPGSGMALARLEKIAALREESVGARLFWWRVTLGMIADYPWLGVGVGRFREVYPAYQRAFFEEHPSERMFSGRFTAEEVPLESPHNEYLHLLADQGMLGFGLFAWLVVSLIAFGRQKLSSIPVPSRPALVGALSATIALLTVGLFAYPFQLPTSALLFGMLAGVILADPEKPRDFPLNDVRSPSEGVGAPRVRESEKRSVIFAARILLTLLSFLYLAFLARIYISSLHLHRGTEHFLRGEYQEAAAVFQQALDVNARDAEIHLALGRALLLSGNPQEAIRHFSFAENGFNSPRLRQDLAGCYVTVGRSDQAEREYVNGIATYPGHAGLHASYGALLAGTGRQDDALINLLRARDLAPRYPDTYHYMGHLFYGRHKPEQAMVALKDFLEYASPSDPRRSIDSRLLDALQAGERAKGGLDAP